MNAPPTRRPYYHGTDFQHADEVIAAEREVDEVAESIGADRLAYRTVEGLAQSLTAPPENCWLACSTGDCPIPAEKGMGKHALESRRR